MNFCETGKRASPRTHRPEAQNGSQRAETVTPFSQVVCWEGKHPPPACVTSNHRPGTTLEAGGGEALKLRQRKAFSHSHDISCLLIPMQGV